MQQQDSLLNLTMLTIMSYTLVFIFTRMDLLQSTDECLSLTEDMATKHPSNPPGTSE